jgi:hypothetical protein
MFRAYTVMVMAFIQSEDKRQIVLSPSDADPYRLNDRISLSSSIRSVSSASSLDSWIISAFPHIFAEFQRKRFSVLWRDGHRRRDYNPDILTVMLDLNSHIFGDFKVDDNLKSFLFTLRNSHNISARRFALKPEQKQYAIWCDFTEWVFLSWVFMLGTSQLIVHCFFWLWL